MRETTQIHWAKATAFTLDPDRWEIPIELITLLVAVHTTKKAVPTSKIKEISKTMLLIDCDAPLPFKARIWTGPLQAVCDQLPYQLSAKKRL